MNKKRLPHIIAVGAFVVFIVLGLGSVASTPKGAVLSDGTSVDFSWYGNGSAKTFTISTATQLAGLSDIVSGAKGSPAKDNFSGKTVVLAADIDLSVVKNWIPIGMYNTTFAGTFDGNGKAVSNLSIAPVAFSNDPSSSLGLFGSLGEGGIVKNIAVKNVNIKGEHYIGGVVGWNRGTVQDCYASGTIDAFGDAGGIVGINDGTVQNCYTTAKVNGRDGSSQTIENTNNGKINTTAVIVSNNVGGVLGFNREGKVQNCVALNPSITRDEYIYDEDRSPEYLASRNATNSRLGSGTTYVYPRKPRTQPSISFGRVVGASTGTFTNNYSLQGMTIPGGSLTGNHGQNISATEAGTEGWWKALTWDFDTVWEWDSTTNLPKLR